MTLDVTPFAKAIAQLEEALAYHASESAQKDPNLKNQLRSASIQAFEFTYELAVKTLKRYLMLHELSPEEAETMKFSDVIRRGYSIGLLKGEIALWRGFRESRAATSHTYKESKAEEVFRGIPAFLAEAKFLLAKLQELDAK